MTTNNIGWHKDKMADNSIPELVVIDKRLCIPELQLASEQEREVKVVLREAQTESQEIVTIALNLAAPVVGADAIFPFNLPISKCLV